MHWHERGFTLVEVIATISLMGILFLVASPQLKIMADAGKLKADAWQLAAAMRAAQQQAVTEEKVFTAVFRPFAGNYQIYNRSSDKCTTFRLHDGIRFVGTTTFTEKFKNCPACNFGATGMSGSGGTVTLENVCGRRMYIITSPILQRIRVSPSPPESWNL